MGGYAGQWLVARVSLTTDAKKFGLNVAYPLHVEGVYRDEPKRSFRWSVPSVKDEGFDLAGAVVDEDAVEAVR